MSFVGRSHFYLLIVFLSLGALSAVAALNIIFDVSIASLTRDIAAIAQIHPLFGILSNLGVLLWCIATSVCLFSAFVLRGQVKRSVFNFLFCSSLLSGYLLIDDFFMFHELIAGEVLNVDEKYVYLALAISVATYLVVFHKVILKTNFVLLFLAFSFLGTSVFVDSVLEQLLRPLGQWHIFLEDGAKWVGIIMWCSYFVDTCFNFVSRNICPPTANVSS